MSVRIDVPAGLAVCFACGDHECGPWSACSCGLVLCSVCEGADLAVALGLCGGPVWRAQEALAELVATELPSAVATVLRDALDALGGWIGAPDRSTASEAPRRPFLVIDGGEPWEGPADDGAVPHERCCGRPDEWDTCPGCLGTFYAPAGHDPLKHHADYCTDMPVQIGETQVDCCEHIAIGHTCPCPNHPLSSIHMNGKANSNG